MSAFDPTAFLNAAVTGAMDTSRPLVTAGEHNAYIDKVEYKSYPITKGDRAGETLHKLELSCKVISPGTEDNDRIIRKDCILDMTPDGRMDSGKGKNVDLGQVREATDLNDPTQPFAPAMLYGKMLRILVAHDVDKADSSKVYARVSRVAKAQ